MQVSYDHRAVLINGKRELVLSGAMHYPRSTPHMWPELMRRSREAWLNTVETYVFWNLHERRQGVFDFSGRLDLLEWCRLAQAEGLNVILRIGPYICAETNYGGFPSWLRDIPGIQMRMDNEPFKREMERWVRLLCDYLTPMFAPNGGPITMIQLENEFSNIAKNYGESGQRYLQWVAELGESLNLGIPQIMCMGSAPGVVETINEANPHHRLSKHYADHPDQPALCTELYSGWYSGWGQLHCTRTAEDLAYAVARFFAEGGTGINYYMWHDGTNWGRETMYMQSTTYGFDSPLNEYGLPNTKYYHLARLHHLVQEYADVLLTNDPPQAEMLGEHLPAFTYRSGERALTFLCNDGPEAATVFAGKEYTLPRATVTIIGDGKVLLDTSKTAPEDIAEYTAVPNATPVSAVTRWGEPLPAEWPEALITTTESAQPVEQLLLTRDETDYCWYSTELTVTETGEGTLTLDRAADVVHVFVDGQFMATTPTPLAETRGRVDSDAYRQQFTVTLTPGKHRLDLLCCAVGLVKGDWQLGEMNMVEERKGLWGPVRWNEQELTGNWRMQPGLVGEKIDIPGYGQVLAPWDEEHTSGQPLSWYRCTFPKPQGDGPFVVDLAGMNKGLAWLNGHCIGRYWMAPAEGNRGPYLNGWLDHSRAGQPVQRYYYLPNDWLSDQNTLILFEELGGDASTINLRVIEKTATTE